MDIVKGLRGQIDWPRSGIRLEAADEIDRLRAEIDAFKAKLDALMFEYCPEEMTPEQIAKWEKAQRPVSAEFAASINAAINGETQ